MGALHYVVQTKPNAEAVAQANLENQDFTVFNPAIVVERLSRFGRLLSTRIEPVFPRYLFVCFDIADPRWRKISNSRGVEKILGWNPERPTAIPNPVITELQQRFACGDFKPRAPRSQFVTAGQTGRVKDGTFADKVAKCSKSKEGRVFLLIEFLGEIREIPFDPANVERVGDDVRDFARFPGNRTVQALNP